MGGPQRLAERAGPARAKELDLHRRALRRRDAGALERRQPRLRPTTASRTRRARSPRKLANGPTKAHAATKAIVRAQKEGGARAADAIVGEVSGALFATEDLKNAVRSFLADGPGKATYEGR